MNFSNEYSYGEGLESIVVKSSELLKVEFPQIKWLIQDYLCPGLTIIHGKAKIGKSLMALQICKSVLTGVDFLQKEARIGKVLYAPLEDSPRRTQTRLKSQQFPLDKQIDLLYYQAFIDNYGTLDDEGGKLFFEDVKFAGYDVVIMDTLALCFNIDQNDNDEVKRVLKPIHEFANSKEVAVILIDHEPKFGDTPLGAQAKQAVSDNLWRLYIDEEKYGARLSIKGRDILPVDTLMLEKEDVTGLWKFFGFEGNRPLKYQYEIITLLRNNGSMTNQEVSEALGVDRSNINRVLSKLSNRGKIHKKSNNGRILYTVPEEY